MNRSIKWHAGRYRKVAGRGKRGPGPAHIILSLYVMALLPATLILMTAVASETGLPWIDALFTATSALTVTGLSVVDTNIHFTGLGQSLLMLLMQIGGLGQMTLSVIILFFLGKKVTLRGQALAREELNRGAAENVVQLIKAIVVFALIVECIGTALLAITWVPELGWTRGLYCSLFHAVSAFNNAGFSLLADSMSGYDDNALTTLTIAGLFIVGGLGFTVMLDLLKFRRYRRLSLHTKLVLSTSLILLLVGTVLIYALEHHNPRTIGAVDGNAYRWLAAFFQSASTRTAGFNSVSIIDLNHATFLLMMCLMFIGAGSTSTGGGIKVSTFAVTIIATTSFLRGRRTFSAFQRNIAPLVVLKSLAIIIVSVSLLISATFILMITEKARFDVVLFETISAFSTVGITAGLTAQLSDIGKLVMVVVMIIGRVGPLTLAYVVTRQRTTKILYADEDVATG
jgi:trk system potassium uptake protein TrkH